MIHSSEREPTSQGYSPEQHELSGDKGLERLERDAEESEEATGEVAAEGDALSELKEQLEHEDQEKLEQARRELEMAGREGGEQEGNRNQSESNPEKEPVDRDELIRRLRAEGIEVPEVQGLLTRWTLQEEAKVEAANTSEASLIFNIERARLYLEGGYIKEALEAFEDARIQAWQEGNEELFQEIEDKIDRAEKEMEKL